MLKPLSVAVIGCGAIAEAFHLPALRRLTSQVAEVVLVDPDEERRTLLASRFEVDATVRDIEELPDRVQAAVVATPHELHAPICLDLVNRGVHVLCEKPLTTDAIKAAALVEAAAEQRVVLAVNHSRRLYPFIWTSRQIVRDGSLGALRSIEILDGSPLEWPLASGSSFGLLGNRQGVLQDLGPHAIDTVSFWTEAPFMPGRLVDDARGGSEAWAKCSFKAGDTSVEVELSWLSHLPDRIRIEGELGWLEGNIHGWSTLTMGSVNGKPQRLRVHSPARDRRDVPVVMLEDFFHSIETGEAPLAGGHEAIPGIQLIEKLYDRRESLDAPWDDTIGRFCETLA